MVLSGWNRKAADNKKPTTLPAVGLGFLGESGAIVHHSRVANGDDCHGDFNHCVLIHLLRDK
jgi:hypothetical protein